MPVLYIVSTPIGNLKDITLRALEVLQGVDFVLAEDTRVTQKLLKAYEIEKPMIAYHEHTASSKKIFDHLREGKNMALVSDAGTPGVNDPGGKLIEEIVNSELEVQIVPIPGPSALTALLSIAGIPLQEFMYRGFIPHKKGRETFLKEVNDSEIPVVFFESVHRVEKMLEQMEQLFDGHKRLILGRELTKMHETVYRGSVQQVRAQLAADQVRGEFVVLVHNAR